jgi:putative membrane protein
LHSSQLVAAAEQQSAAALCDVSGMKTFPLIALALAGGALVSACTTDRTVAVNTVTPAPATTVVMGAPARPFNAVDTDFVLTAASSNMFEIGASQMAAKHTSSADVLQLAGMMNRDHTQAMNELIALMKARGMAVPQEMSPDKQRLMDKLATNRGADFDQVYVMQAGVHAHEADITAFQQRLAVLSDPELKAWVTRNLTPMQQHLDMSRQIAAKLG